jgi:hypothetical protein
MEPQTPFLGLDDSAVLDYAIAALRRAQGAAPGSRERLRHWASYELANAELQTRLYQYTLNKIQEDSS